MDREQVIGWLNGYAANRRTICEVHREIWDEVQDMPDSDLKETLEGLVMEAFDMGKSMQKGLTKKTNLLLAHGIIKEGSKLLPKNPNKHRSRERRRKRVEVYHGE